MPAPDRAVPGVAKAGTPASGPPRPGLREQIGNTKRAGTGLVKAHIDLAKAEFGEILSLVKTLGVLAGVALGIALFTGNLVYVGTWLFLGEWLFGSLGWGVLHGLLFGTGILVMLGLLIVGVGAGRAVTAFLVSALAGVLVGLLLGSNILPNTVDTLLAGTSLAIGFDPGVLAVAGVVALVLGVVGLILGARAGGPRAAIAGLVGGVIVGFVVGLIVGGRYDWRVAAAIGVTVALLLWSVLQFVFGRSQIDLEKRFAALKPTETIETAKETKEWLGQQWANRRSKLGRR
ncbi:MAG: hypothetical protein H0W07_04555 [Chloroflexi bacterium]|nr:hypothetical protein [Chloroflexota bacterium]